VPHFLRAENVYLATQPDFARSLVCRRIRTLTDALLKRGSERNWSADPPESRTMFKVVMRQAYGDLFGWMYMLPLLLLLPSHRRLVHRLRSRHDRTA